jgi:predicted AAA+ superfamily ATPase
MNVISRNLTQRMGFAQDDSLEWGRSDLLKTPMIFVTGPRQIGKTTEISSLKKPYYNWDTIEVKKAFFKDPYFFRGNQSWIIFDEIHKRKDWKKLLKGYFDSPSRKENFVITGSARLGIYQKAGDSLQGRYELFHLFPVTYDEWSNKLIYPKVRDFTTWEPDSIDSAKSDLDLLRLGGFPEPLAKASETFLNKWLDLYLQRLIREDIRDFSKVELLDSIEMLSRILPLRMSGPLSIKSLSEDLNSSWDSVKNWLRLFEVLYLGFTLRPFHYRIERAVKKEKKWYFFQWAFVEDPGIRFENYIAVQLLTVCQSWRDAGLGNYELSYIRDQDRREVDFLITKNLQPIALIEAKLSAQPFPSSLRFYAQKLKVPAFLVYLDGPTKKEDLGYSLSSRVFFKNIT